MWKMCSMSAKRQLWNVPELCQSGKGKTDLCPPKMRCTQEKSQSWKGTLSRKMTKNDQKMTKK